MHDDTDIGGRADRFPTTRRSAIAAASSEDKSERARALETLISVYWKPAYKYIRIKWHKSNEDAKDLTQGFFATVIEKDFFRGYDPSKARFRTFLRSCLDGYLANEDRAKHRLKRGGGVLIESLDFETAEGELASVDVEGGETPEEYFEREWTRSFFTAALEALQEECKSTGKEAQYQLFELYYLGDRDEAGKITYETLSQESGLTVTTVTNYLNAARRSFRRIALDRLRELTATDEEFRKEARSLFGSDDL